MFCKSKEMAKHQEFRENMEHKCSGSLGQLKNHRRNREDSENGANKLYWIIDCRCRRRCRYGNTTYSTTRKPGTSIIIQKGQGLFHINQNLDEWCHLVLITSDKVPA